MNLAAKDIQHNLGRFALTTLGIGHAADDRDGHGGHLPRIDRRCNLAGGAHRRRCVGGSTRYAWSFAEVSRVPRTLVYRALAVPGVESAREFVFHTIQRQHRGQPLRMSVLGLSWPLDKGQWLPLIAGRPLAQNHYEMVADKTLGLRLHERIQLEKRRTPLSASRAAWSVPAATG